MSWPHLWKSCSSGSMKNRREHVRFDIRDEPIGRVEELARQTHAVYDGRVELIGTTEKRGPI